MPSATERAQIRAINAELRGVAEGVVKNIGRGVLDELAETTPKDTGFTAAAWRARAGRPVPFTVGGRTLAGVAKAKAAQAASRGAIANYGLGHGRLFISNPSPNAGALNSGTSTQEPRAFVQRSIFKVLTLLKVTRPRP